MGGQNPLSHFPPLANIRVVLEVPSFLENLNVPTVPSVLGTLTGV